MELAFLSAVEQARLVRTGEVSSTELVAALPRAHRSDRPRAELVRHGLRRGGARASARPSTRRRATHRFAAFRSRSRTSPPTAGIRTTYSSRAYAHYVPDFDTAVVRRIREAGFVIVGKTNTPEFGTVAFTESDLNGATRNPWNTEPRPAARAAAPQRQSQRVSFRSPTRRTAAARSASRRRAAASSG